MKIFFILFLLVSYKAKADFIFSPGVSATAPFQSLEQNMQGQELLKGGAGLGLTAGLEWIVFSPLTIGIGAGFYLRSAEVQYNYLATQAEDLNTSMSQLNLDLGAKLRLINFKRFKAFIGAGLSTGRIGLTYDKEDFVLKTGNTTGFEESDGVGYNSFFLETGIEYIISNTGGLRFSARKVEMDTESFKTIGGESLTIDYTSFAIQYMHYVDWSFFWK